MGGAGYGRGHGESRPRVEPRRGKAVVLWFGGNAFGQRHVTEQVRHAPMTRREENPPGEEDIVGLFEMNQMFVVMKV
ncbi:hypothetical protein NHX12_030053 [Muraenolepis orangiensis]|uniref:Uncharacterized protein n=1 Tax=Muraenolepis orangiensis TaxID=630683 RepID=A0A9Q0E936_9TELE|nr:hypothetical protein NHX12_030053 [Muraenolepis orangiensis]